MKVTMKNRNANLKTWHYIDMTWFQGHGTSLNNNQTWNIIRVSIKQKTLNAGTQFLTMHARWALHQRWDLGSDPDTPWVMDYNYVKYHPNQIYQWKVILAVCPLLPWLRRYDIGSRSWHTFGSWPRILWSIILIDVFYLISAYVTKRLYM